jgi:hypothetical protein
MAFISKQGNRLYCAKNGRIGQSYGNFDDREFGCLIDFTCRREYERLKKLELAATEEAKRAEERRRHKEFCQLGFFDPYTYEPNPQFRSRRTRRKRRE